MIGLDTYNHSPSSLIIGNSRVLELSSQGYSEREIAEKLQPLAVCTVHRDLVFLRKQACDNLWFHICDRIPEEYQNCMTGLKRIIRLTTEISDIVTDPNMDLTTGGVIVVTDAIKYVQVSTPKGKRTYHTRLPSITANS